MAAAAFWGMYRSGKHFHDRMCGTAGITVPDSAGMLVASGSSTEPPEDEDPQNKSGTDVIDFRYAPAGWFGGHPPGVQRSMMRIRMVPVRSQESALPTIVPGVGSTARMT